MAGERLQALAPPCPAPLPTLLQLLQDQLLVLLAERLPHHDEQVGAGEGGELGLGGRPGTGGLGGVCHPAD